MRRDAIAATALIGGLSLAAVSFGGWWGGQVDEGRVGRSDSPYAEPPATGRPTQTPGPTTAPTETPRQEPRPVVVRPGRPSQLRIPALGVRADVTAIGMDGSRTLVPPPDATTVGWWSAGAMPGSHQGASILTGHTVHTGGGALDNLEEVAVGDQVQVVRPRLDLVYTVQSVRTYRKGALASQAARLFSQSGPGRLVVVTCEDWNGEIYLSNVVVVAADPQPVRLSE